MNGDHRAMRIVITGGLGMLGTELARRLRATRPQDELLLLDVPAAAAPPADLADAIVLRGDIRDAALLSSALDSPEVAVVHLASILSGGAEVDFDAALGVNLDGGRALVEACRAHGGAPRLVFTSSLATFGGELALGTVDDGTRQTPRGTYGATKAMLEMLFADATRKGFLDVRSVRPPTVIVRPGAPNSAASSFASAVVRDPLAGRPTALPVSLDQEAVVIGVDTTVGCLARVLEIDGDELGDGRALNLPGLLTTPRELLAALHALVDPATLAPVTVEPDAATEAIVQDLDDRLALVAGGRPRPPARRGCRRDRARLPGADRPVSARRDAALAACARQEGAELTFPFGEQTAVYKVERARSSRSPGSSTAAADHAQVRPRARRGAALRARRDPPGLPHEQAPLDHGDARRQPAATRSIEELIEDSFDLVAPRKRA